MNKALTILAVVAFAGVASAAQVTTIAPGGASATVEDAALGISYSFARIDDVTDLDGNGFADSIWEVRISADADSDWTNVRYRTETPGFDFFDNGTILFGSRQPYEGTSSNDAAIDGSLGAFSQTFAGTENVFMADPSGDAAQVSPGPAVWPNGGRGPVDIGIVQPSTFDDVNFANVLNGTFVIPDGETGDFFIQQIWGPEVLTETFTMGYNPTTESTFIVPEPATALLLGLSALFLRRRRA